MSTTSIDDTCLREYKQHGDISENASDSHPLGFTIVLASIVAN